jgi:signal transduction histidine kinase/Tfp pilus assembly protein PilF
MKIWKAISNQFLFFGIIIFTLFCATIACSKAENKDQKAVPLVDDRQVSIKELLDKAGSFAVKQPDSVLFLLDSAAKQIQPNDYELQARSYLLESIFYWYTSRLDTSLVLMRRNLQYAIKHQLNRPEMLALSNMGTLFNVMGQPDSALLYLRRTLDKVQIMNDSSSMGKVYFDLGVYYNRKEYSHLALEHLQKSQAIFESMKDSVRVCYTYSSLGIVYQNIGDFEKSVYYSNKAIEFDEALPQMNMLADLFNNLGVTYWQLKSDFATARKYFYQSIEIESPGDKNVKLFSFLVNCGGMEIKANNISKGYSYLNRATKVELPYRDDYRTSALYINLGKAHTLLGNYDSANYCLRHGLEMARSIEAYEQISVGFEGLYQLDSIRGDFRSALAYQTLFVAVKDSMDNISHRNKIAELDIIYESKQKEEENLYLKSENELQNQIIRKQKLVTWVVGLGLFLILLILVFLWKNRQKLKAANRLLEKRNAEVDEMNSLIRVTNKNLEDQKEELVQLNQTKDKFFSVIAHDLKNPFNSLLGFLEILDSNFLRLQDDEKHKIIKRLHINSRNTYNMLVNLLDWARSQRGLIKSNPRMVNLSEVAKEALEFLKERILDKNHRIEINIKPDDMAFADPQLLQTVLINMINNAIKFTARGGNISISCTGNGHSRMFAINDTGMGMSSEMVKDLFTINSKASMKDTEDELGTGLGLIICKEFVVLMGGEIHVESQLGRGTTFYVTIPATNPALNPF